LRAFRFHNPGEEWWDLPFDPDRRQVDFSMISGKVVFQKSDNKGGNQ